jgi:hypothetical protein
VRTDDGVALGGFDNRFPIGTDFKPHQSKQYIIEMKAPSQPGQYRLDFDLVQEMVAWFSSRHSRRGELPVTVNGSESLSSTRVAAPILAATPGATGAIYDFRAGSFDPSMVSGFHPAEAWGMWSNADPAEVRFRAPVNGVRSLTLVARAVVKDKNNVLRVTLGGETQRVTLDAGLSTYVLHFKLSSGADRVVFRGVRPTPGTAFGIPDPRPMGFALARIELSPNEGSSQH